MVRLFEGERRSFEFISQLYFDDAITDEVHVRPPYSAKGSRDTRNSRDRIFQSGGSGDRLMLRLRREDSGYLGEFSVGLRVAS